jgi:hypothetical protein
LIVALALSSGAFALAWLGKVLPFRVHVFRDRIRIPRTKKSFDVNAATKVAVEVHPENDKLRRVAVLSGRDVDFLVHEGRAGAAAHQRAAQKLGQLLELPVDLGPDRVETPWKLPTLPRSIPRRWKIILGLFLFATTASGIVGLYASRTQGTIEIDCQGRCRFENMECLPGGSVAMSAEPGTFRIETWAPDSAEHWKPNDVQIRAGATTKFVCPATR